MKMDADHQLRDVRKTVLRLGGNVGEESYQEVCRYALSRVEIDWTHPQQGRLIRLAQRIIRCARYKARNPPKSRPACFTDVAADFDPERCSANEIRNNDERRTRLRDAICTLPPLRRFALQQFIEGAKDEEVASGVGVRVELIRQWRRRDTNRLRVILRNAG